MKMITYTFPEDFENKKLAGKTFSGGKPGMATMGKKMIQVVSFEEEKLSIRIEGRPELKKAHDEYITEEKTEMKLMIKSREDALEAAIPGIHELMELSEHVSDDFFRENREFGKMMEDEDNDGVRPPRRANRADAEKLATMKISNPRAALYLRAKNQSEAAHWADNSGSGEAGERVMEILLTGGSLEEAKTALGVRREFND